MFFKRLMIATVSALIIGCATSVSKERAQEPAELIELQVGSRIPRLVDPANPNWSTISPVTVITRDQIDNTGAVSVADALRRSGVWIHLGP